jgi:hypothetical protein
MKPKLTPWFPAEVRPAHDGVYQTLDPAGIVAYQHWNGSFWGFYAFTAEDAHDGGGSPSCQQYNEWRGLAEDPAKEEW